MLCDRSTRGFRQRRRLLAGSLVARSGYGGNVIHPTSVAVSRKHRRSKTDRLDTAMLMRVFLGWLRGECGHCSMVDPHARGRGRQAAEPRAREPGGRTHLNHQQREGRAAQAGNPELQPQPPQSPQAARYAGHARGSVPAAKHSGRDPMRSGATGCRARAD